MQEAMEGKGGREGGRDEKKEGGGRKMEGGRDGKKGRLHEGRKEGLRKLRVNNGRIFLCCVRCGADGKGWGACTREVDVYT
jgi:hypothetical protein